MSTRSIRDLEQLLAGEEPSGIGPDLDLIHRRGRMRRRARVGAAAGSALALSAVLGVTLASLGGGVDSVEDPTTAAAAQPGDDLGQLAQRALAEIPGARKISATRVLIPGPGQPEMGSIEDFSMRGTPVALPEVSYGGVTLYRSADFPNWLYDGTDAAEKAAGESDGSHQVGTYDLTGVVVDRGERYLGCVRPSPRSAAPGIVCAPAMVTKIGHDWYYDWGMGTEDFLQAGEDMEVFTSDSTIDGADGTLAIAGIDGVEVARAEMVAVDGTRTDGVVLAGTLVPGDTMIYGEVPGELARVIAYDADGNVIEDHELRDCDSPVDCEVR